MPGPSSIAGPSKQRPRQQHQQHYPNLQTSTQLAKNFQQPLQFRRTVSSQVDCTRILNKTFGKTAWRGRQREIVEAAVRGADVLVIAPTGMGKSICFQVPACAEEHGVTIVVSPLLALMKNQVEYLRSLNVPVFMLTSESTYREKEIIAKDLASGHPRARLMYTTPETLCGAAFMRNLQIVYEQKELCRLVVDEAHCISEWGSTFRPDYRALGFFRQSFPDVPIMALTASATPDVQEDIVENLHLSRSHLFKTVEPFNRKNLFYEVRYRPTHADNDPDRLRDVSAFVRSLHHRAPPRDPRHPELGKMPVSGIIYARTKAACDALAETLREVGVKAEAYHRGLSQRVLERTMKGWVGREEVDNGEVERVDVVCATIAFGMGIDKPDVRYVVHFDVPKSFEGYYQETGRAGRDGLLSRCLLYYSREDGLKIQRLVHKEQGKGKNNVAGGAAGLEVSAGGGERGMQSLQALIDLAESASVCRHVSICRFFGEKIDDQDPALLEAYCGQKCDVCLYPADVRKRRENLSSDDYVASQRPQLERTFSALSAFDDTPHSDGDSGDPSHSHTHTQAWNPGLLDPPQRHDDDGFELPGDGEPAFEVVDLAAESEEEEEEEPVSALRVARRKVQDEVAATEEILARRKSSSDGGGGNNGAVVERLKHRQPSPLARASESRAPLATSNGSVGGGGGRSRLNNNGNHAEPDEPPSRAPPAAKKARTGGQSASFVLEASPSSMRTPQEVLRPNGRDIFPIVAPRPKMRSSQSFKTPFKTAPPTPAELTVISTAQRGKKGKAAAAAPQALSSAAASHDRDDASDFRLELAVTFSQKIPEQLRHSALIKLARELRNALVESPETDTLWALVGGGDKTQERSQRLKLTSKVAVEVEFDIMSMSISPEGFNTRFDRAIVGIQLLRDTPRAVALLSRNSAEDDEDRAGEDGISEARDIMEVLRRFVKTTQGGRGRGRG